MRVTCRLRLHRRRPIPAVRCPPTARTCGLRPRPCQPGRRAFRLRRRPTHHPHQAHHRPTPQLAPAGELHKTGAARSELAPSSSQQAAPTGIAGKAVAAGALGAVAGAASADATARIRLQRIVDAVARQESRLAWAAGDRPDDTTVLLTDLADGWIPPGIEIPAVGHAIRAWTSARRPRSSARRSQNGCHCIRLTATCPKQMSRCPRLRARGMRRRSRNWVGSSAAPPIGATGCPVWHTLWLKRLLQALVWTRPKLSCCSNKCTMSGSVCSTLIPMRLTPNMLATGNFCQRSKR